MSPTSYPASAPHMAMADSAGNIYIAEIVRPKGWKQPPELKDGTLASHYGSIVKFSPKGGMVHFDGVDPFTGQPKLDPGLKVLEADWPTGGGNLKPVKITGAEWMRTRFGTGTGAELAYISVVVLVAAFLRFVLHWGWGRTVNPF